MTKLPTFQQYRESLAQLIVQKDAINAGMTQLLHQLDSAGEVLQAMIDEADNEDDKDS